MLNWCAAAVARAAYDGLSTFRRQKRILEAVHVLSPGNIEASQARLRQLNGQPPESSQLERNSDPYRQAFLHGLSGAMPKVHERNGPCNIVEMLQERAAQAPTSVGYRFLSGKEEEAAVLTYAQLDHRARAIGGWVRSRCGAQCPVALIFPPGLEFITAFYGTLYGGGIAVPLNPPASKNSTARLEAVLRDANCRVALTTRDQLPRIARACRECAALLNVEFVAIETIGDDALSDWRDPRTDAESVVVVQYTSGSTAEPKGVKLRDRNLLHNVSMTMLVSRLSTSDVGVSWLPHYHDMGLIAGILMPAFGRFPVVLMPAGGFLSQPIRWLDAISRYHATVSGAPNFAYEECVRRVRKEELERIDLSSWRVAYCGAEPIRPDTIKRFVAAFARFGFRERSFFPCYGLAESTLMVTGGPAESLPVIRWLSKTALRDGHVVDAPADSPSATAVLASGALIPDNKVVIVDPESRVVCRQGQIGEIWLSGPSVADGYWNVANATEEVFGAFLPETKAGPFLRTGDLGFVEIEMLFVVGRCKDLIIIRGLNHFPQDIELTIERCHPSIVPGCGAAFSVDLDGEEKLVVVHEIDRHVTEAVHQLVFESIIVQVAKEHGLQVHVIVLIKQGTIAKTTSGKVQRQRSRFEFMSNKLKIVSQWRAFREEPAFPIEDGGASLPRADLSEDAQATDESEVERVIISELAQLLRIDIGEIDPERSIYDLGVDSLLAAQLQNRILSRLHFEVTQSEVMRSATIRELASMLGVKGTEEPAYQPEDDLARIVDHVEQLSEEKVIELLRAKRGRA
jgi:acyl-CoA synthetase (AMP-forming)/AMP-acid ligase II/acyl carrier protein